MFKNICRSTNLVRQTTQNTATKGVNTTSAQNLNSNSNSNLLLITAQQQGTTSSTARCLLSTSASVSTKKTSPSAAAAAIASNVVTLRRSKSQTQFTLLPRLSRFRTMSTGSAAGATGSGSSQVDKPKFTNRLAQERSPYLLQHAHNPVDWYPWGDEAIEKARNENKLIFLSVGYSTCHWCHVMEHESFENEEVAALMNKHFVNIKVDREERPDIDRIYMQFVLMMNGSGGWPMSVWLTPDLAPITAGTYFPPHDRWGMPSFKTVLRAIASKWIANEEQLKSTGLEVISAIQKSLSEKSTETVFEPGSADAKLQEALKIFSQRFDVEFGGFGNHPKFPEVARLNFLFHAYIVTKKVDILNMAVETLHHIGRGGIHDHVFGGFARYSVDRKWHVPHFEKMLYDQGQLLAAYANAYKLTRDETFREYADGIYRYITTDLQHPAGGFYAGEDADSLPKAEDSKKVEGAFYAWTYKEIQKAIEDNKDKYSKVNMSTEKIFEIYSHHYDVKPLGNVDPSSDPHGHLNAKNILIVRGSIEETCKEFSLEEQQLKEILQLTNDILNDIRKQRPRPHLDTKIICSWNGLVLTGLCKLANCGGAKRPEYMATSAKLVKFMHENLYDKEKKLLKRSCYGVATNDTTLQENLEAEQIDGFLDDYAFLIKGLLDYYKASLDPFALQWAKELQEVQDNLFWDSEHGAYFYSKANSPNVVVRLKDDHDGAEPCGNSVAARNLILLSHYFDDDSYAQRASKLFEFFSDQQPFGYALPEMLSALMLHENGLDLVAVVGPDSETTKKFVEICRKYYIPGMIIVHVNPQDPEHAYNQRVQQKFKMINGQTTVYICHDKVCRMPVTDPVKLEENLTENFFKGRV
ncbi:spermatogenesis-associated protein 20 [Lucilia sericata]|uniref:spermatogenesis-associated protein 20 n=1 Tax=Lucilia sericata TaxID=13632 RepID=UPI0018A84BB2|nr:spermatogenesis-associated protein 20 [Lucilia sericata]